MGNNAESREPIINTDQINHVEVDVSKLVATKKLAASIESKIKSMPSPKCCIHRVPQQFRDGKEESLYIPQIVSIGPFHRGEPKLQGMEEHKKWYLEDLLRRSQTKLEDLVNAIWDMESDARECYGGELLNYDLLSKDDFVEMMLLDGCFILQLFFRYWDKFKERLTYENDRILIANWTIPSWRQDMMLLENQIPSAVLEALYDVINKNPQYKRECSLIDLVAFFFDPMCLTEATPATNSTTKGVHLLDFLRNYLFPSAPEMTECDREALQFTICATSLSEAGVKLKKKVESKGLLDITFSKDNGVFEIPRFLFGKSRAALLLNLMALEQLQGYDERVTSYVHLLDCLINSGNDVKLLREKEIIYCFSSEDEKMSSLINNLGKGISVTTFYYEGLCDQVNAYCKSYWHRSRATLKRDYFNNPWAIISVIAAIVLLLLTLAQTVISFLAYPAFH